MPSRLSSRNKKLADKLVALHNNEPSYKRLPAYDFMHLRKGRSCSGCHSFNVFQEAGKLICNECGCKEGIDDAVLRSVEEIKLLFPDMKITANVVWEWCGVVSVKTIRRVLKQNYTCTGKKEYSFLSLK